MTYSSGESLLPRADMDWALGRRDHASDVALKVPVDSIARINICCNSHWTNTVATEANAHLMGGIQVGQHSIELVSSWTVGLFTLVTRNAAEVRISGRTRRAK